MIDSQVQIDRSNPVQQKNFAKWLNEVGFNLFMKSEHNAEEVVTCIATNEEM